MIFATTDTHNLSAWTVALDIVGFFALAAGGYLAARSTYAKENSKDAALLIDTQRKRIDSLVDELKHEQTEREKLKKTVHQMSGELNAYKRLAYIEPEVITKLTSTLDAILGALTKDGLHVDTQTVGRQIINKGNA